MLNFVVLKGIVKSIDLTTRDIILTTKTPRLGKDIDVKVHMWKVRANADGSMRPDWTTAFATGDTVAIEGHMGNNGRVIAMGYSNGAEDPAEEND